MLRKTGSTSEAFELTIRPEPWVQDAACNRADPQTKELFFGQRQELAATLYCSKCPVTWQCFEYATRFDMEYGVWGGLPQWDRRDLLRKNDWKLDHFLQVAHAQYVKQLRIRARKSA